MSCTKADKIAKAARHSRSNLRPLRPATKPELASVDRLAKQQTAYLHAAHRKKLQTLLTNGETPVRPDIDPAELAAWTLVASAIFNLDETITKE